MFTAEMGNANLLKGQQLLILAKRTKERRPEPAPITNYYFNRCIRYPAYLISYSTRPSPLHLMGSIYYIENIF